MLAALYLGLVVAAMTAESIEIVLTAVLVFVAIPILWWRYR